jgi:hypothetical protein
MYNPTNPNGEITTNARPEISWIGSLKQWRKRHKGKTYYLGTANGKTDAEGRARALAKWRGIQAGLEADHAAKMKPLTDVLAKIGDKGFTFSNLRDTASTEIKMTFPHLHETFLMHRDPGMGKFYVDGKVAAGILDPATDHLEAFFGLEHN